MPRNGSGTFAYSVGYPFTTGTVISSTDMNSVLLDIANNLTSSIAKDGQTTATADIPMGGFKFTSVGDAVLRTQFPSVGQIEDGGLIKIGAVAGTNTITGTITPSIGSSGYVSGQFFTLVPAATNTGATTIALNSLAAKNILKDGAALAAGDLVINRPVLIYYDGTQFNLVGGSYAITASVPASLLTGTIVDARLSTNVPLLNAANTFTNATQTISAAGNPGLVVQSTSTGFSYAQFKTNSTARALLGSPGATNDIITGSAVGDFAIRSESGGFLFSGDAGTTIHFKLSSSGLLTTPNASAQEVGYKGMPQNSQSVDYTLVLTDADKYLVQTGASKTFTIPSNASVAFPIGTVIFFESVQGTSIAITTDTLYLAGTGYATTGTRTLAAGGVATAVKRGATSWIISGVGLS